MFINRPYLPEGMNQSYQENAEKLFILNDMKKYNKDSLPLELYINRCDNQHNLHGTLNGFPAIIRRSDAISSDISGAEKEISVLSLVGKYVCCKALDTAWDSSISTPIYLSRKEIQKEALLYLFDNLNEGDVIPAIITSISPIGVFADIGCGIIALLPIRQISVSRITHPQERFSLYQHILVSVDKIDCNEKRFLLSHKELLGTWQENADCFQEGETVTGTVRGIKNYGIFIELAPNLTGLAEPDERLQEGDRVSVLIKTILPEKHKIKLHIVGKLPPCPQNPPMHYYIKSGNVSNWSYYSS